MIRWLSALAIVVGPMTALPGVGVSSCASADKSFHGFLQNFKTDQSFRESRTLFPLRIGNSSGSQTLLVYLSQTDLNKYKPEELPDLMQPLSEGQNARGSVAKCETTRMSGNRYASLVRYSCDDPDEATQYTFTSHLGCWQLEYISQIKAAPF